MDCSTIKEMSNEYEKPDKPTNYRIPRRAPKIKTPDEHSNEMWYQ